MMLEKLEKKDYEDKLLKVKNKEREEVSVFLEEFIRKFYCEEGDFYILKQDYKDYEKGRIQFEKKCLMSDSLEGFTGVEDFSGGKNVDIDEKDKERRIGVQEEQEKKIKKYEDLLIRKQAEFDNYKKRTLRHWEDFRLRSSQTLVEKLLPIMDNLEKAREVEENMGLKDGTLLIEKQMRKVLSEENVEKIKSEGGEFNPSEHEAVQIEETGENYEVDTVIKEWQSGYKLGGKVIRTAKVVVAKGGGNFEGGEEVEGGIEGGIEERKSYEKKN